MTATPATPPSPAYPPAAPPAPGAQQGPKLSANWTGALMAIGAVVAAVGTFLPWEKFIFRGGDGVVGSTSQFTGLGSETRNGPAVFNFTYGNAGKIVLVAAVVVLVLGILAVAKRGRLWVSIVALLASAAALLFALVAFAAPASDQKDVRANSVIQAREISADVIVKGGVMIASIGAGIMLLGSLLALIVRRRSA